MKMPKKCPAGKVECPLLDMSVDGTIWCDSSTDIYGFEQCPWPKKRDKAIKKSLTEESQRTKKEIKDLIRGKA